MIGKPSYTYLESTEGNMFLKMCKCITVSMDFGLPNFESNIPY